jgi:hypothetical protein
VNDRTDYFSPEIDLEQFFPKASLPLAGIPTLK